MQMYLKSCSEVSASDDATPTDGLRVVSRVCATVAERFRAPLVGCNSSNNTEFSKDLS